VRRLIFLYGLTLFASPGMLQWIFQGFDRMKPVALASVVRQIVFALLVLCLIRNPNQLSVIPYLEMAAVAAVIICNYFLLRALLPRLRIRWTLSGALVAFRETLPIGLSELTWACTWYFPTVLLALMVGGAPVGWFGAALRPVMAMHGFVYLYFYNMLPSLSRVMDAPREELQQLAGRSMAFTAWPAVFVAVGGTLFAEPALVLVFGEGYRPSVRVFQILVWVLSIALLSGHHRYILVAFNLQRYEFLSALYTAILSVGLCLLLIPEYGAEGAAIALLLSSLVNWALAYWYVVRKVEVIRIVGHLVRPALAGALMWGAFALLTRWNFWIAAAGSVLTFVLAFAALRSDRRAGVPA
jgi:O-antigen/teichoic acid export membrane protein